MSLDIKEIQNIAQIIQCLILDVDGVMTDGRLLMGDDGQEYKSFNYYWR